MLEDFGSCSPSERIIDVANTVSHPDDLRICHGIGLRLGVLIEDLLKFRR